MEKLLFIFYYYYYLTQLVFVCNCYFVPPFIPNFPKNNEKSGKNNNGIFITIYF